MFPTKPLTPEKLRAIIKTHLPAWLKACASDTDAIVVHEAAFDLSGRELFLFACAIKYAAQKGKVVHVTYGGSVGRNLPETLTAAAVFLERHPTKRRASRPRVTTKSRSRENGLRGG